MKRLVLCVLALVCCFMFVACDDVKDSSDSENKYFIKKIETTPDDWSYSSYQCYYYHKDTGIIYFGNRNLLSDNIYLVKLESEEYCCYIYDEESNSFIGVER